ncbi:ankyrin repeat-containing domain protein [Xylariaceae sp. FL1272]|nr:ankyrin repeat-containing domain protein [Xylariaceae sp. FL1272]
MALQVVYTVGWLCAVQVELVAAQELLDEEHDTDELELPINDNNSYALGRMGKHNVVIAAMPLKQYGLVSAATVARDMSHSFPNVRIGLMVGIGGGVPSPHHDIRLGDIVVGSPVYGTGGVLQYDYGKAIQGEEFATTGHLNQPPQLFLTALAQLDVQYSRKGHAIEETVQEVCQKTPRLRSRFCRPELSTDRLYSKTYVHGGSEGCEIGCDEAHLITRQPRAETENNPAIHHGLIASANRVMKDAELRDKLAANHDILCCEMEAAGLMNHFPCLVVRGICDYSDSHKNKAWQGYAAMVAAVYAKDLLKKIAPKKVESERRMGEMLHDMQEEIKQVQLGIESLDRNDHSDRIGNWLSPPDPSTNYSNALKSRHPGSGKWFLQHSAYLDWKSEENSFLWLHGIPGCGKTVLSSTIIEHLMEGGASNILYFYFDFNDNSKQEFDTMIRSLVIQLYGSCGNTRSQLDSLYDSHREGKRQPTSDSLRAAFDSMIKEAENVHIVLDALDECPNRNEHRSGGLLFWIQSFHQSHPNVHLMLTSRPEQDIMDAIRNWSRDQVILSMQNNLVQEDIDAYIHGRLRGTGILSQRWRTRPDVQDEIEAALMEKADGMFRWATCQLDELEKCIAPREVRKALANLPKTLDETYSRIIANIVQQGHGDVAIRILQFITYSKWPLTLEELVDAIAVDLSAESFDPKDRVPAPEEIAKYCSSLVLVSEENRIYDVHKSATVIGVRLAHFSVKDNNTRKRMLLNMEYSLTNKRLVKMFPLADYAARHWTSHARETNSSTPLHHRLSTGFFTDETVYTKCHHLHPVTTYRRGFYYESSEVPLPLYYASRAGLTDTVSWVLAHGADINAQTSHYGSALSAASWKGHDKTVEMLLKQGANVNTRHKFESDPLCAASRQGHEKIVERLLIKGAVVINNLGPERNALCIAALEGHRNIVEMLLDKGANVNTASVIYHEAIYNASRKGHEAIVRLLLSKVSDVNAYEENEYMQSLYVRSLYYACEGGHKNIVDLLLNIGVDINAHDGVHDGVLQVASREGHGSIVETLLDKVASREGHGSIVETLLDKGADINAWPRFDGNALYTASYNGHGAIVGLLLRRGADVNAAGPKNGEYYDAFEAALSRGHKKITKMLLSHGAFHLNEGSFSTSAME